MSDQIEQGHTQEHTPEPFSVLDCPNCPNQGWYEITCANGDPAQQQCQFCECEPRSRFNHDRRIRACWNFCKGKPTELLEAAVDYDNAPDDAGWEAPHPIFRMAADIDALRARVAVLEGALKDLCARYETLFRLYAPHTYAANCDPTSDLDLALTTARSTLQGNGVSHE